MRKKMILMAVAMMMAAGMTAQTESANRDKQRQHGVEQRSQLTPEQMAEQRSQRAARKMGLSDEQAKKFATIYADYSRELRAAADKYPTPREQAMKERRAAGRQDGPAAKGERKAKPQMDDKQLEQMHKDRFARQRAELDVQEKYYKKFRTVLTERQYAQLMKMDKGGKKAGRHDRKAFGKRAGMSGNKKGGKKGGVCCGKKGGVCGGKCDGHDARTE